MFRVDIKLDDFTYMFVVKATNEEKAEDELQKWLYGEKYTVVSTLETNEKVFFVDKYKK